MKKSILFAIVSLALVSVISGQKLKPYILAGSVNGTDMSSLKSNVISDLKANGFEVLGSYNPMQKQSRVLIVVSHPELIKAVKKTGGFTGFAAALRVGLTQQGDNIDISYTNPEYWGAAYFQKSFESVSANISAVTIGFQKSLGKYGDAMPFGSEKGLTVKSLQKYHYMMGMPYFEDNVKLGTFDSYSAAVKHIDQKFKTGVPGLKKVYEKSLPSKNIKLYGVALTDNEGEKKFMPTIDIGTPKHTAFLPYELLVYNDKAYMLHGRFRIALSFPDLTMGTFMKIVSTPGHIEDMLSKLCE